MRLFHGMYGLHGGEVGGFLRRFGPGHGYAQQRAGGQNGHEGAGPLEEEPPAQRSPRLAERPPGPSQGAAAYRLLDVAVGEVRQDDRRGQAQGEQGQPVERHVQFGAGHHEHRPVPEVDAVRAYPYPAQWSRPRRRAPMSVYGWTTAMIVAVVASPTSANPPL